VRTVAVVECPGIFPLTRKTSSSPRTPFTHVRGRPMQSRARTNCVFGNESSDRAT
jgi:hypothetical protein